MKEVNVTCDSLNPCCRQVKAFCPPVARAFFPAYRKKGLPVNGNPFIKALQACQTSSPLNGGGFPPPGLAT
ncbi:hypothetical protein B6R99_29265 [Klebsiella pneumoniae]|nr:hypothetical protein B6R99_29265 [Klebsiella pneumoniae]